MGYIDRMYVCLSTTSLLLPDIIIVSLGLCHSMGHLVLVLTLAYHCCDAICRLSTPPPPFLFLVVCATSFA